MKEAATTCGVRVAFESGKRAKPKIQKWTDAPRDCMLLKSLYKLL